jgi:hypothetical protein
LGSPEALLAAPKPEQPIAVQGIVAGRQDVGKGEMKSETPHKQELTGESWKLVCWVESINVATRGFCGGKTQ